MSRAPIPSTSPTTITGQDAAGRALRLQKSSPLQLSLFQTFVCEPYRYSNTIDLYDAMPKYFASTKEVEQQRSNGFLKTVTREFRHKTPGTTDTTTYSLRVMPARLLLKGGEEKEFFPTKREELVEAALRKVACEQLSGVYLDQGAGVQFTLSQLRRELEHRGHGINYPSLIEALKICQGTNLELTQRGFKKPVLKAALFPVLMLSDRDEWRKDPKTARCYVQFNPLVTRSIEALSYRQFDYEKYMELESQLSRWLFKRLSHHFVQASIDGAPYAISAARIIGDSHLVNNQRLRDQIKTIDLALEALTDHGILTHAQKLPVVQGRKILDAKYALFPSRYFVDEAKAANYRKQHLVSLDPGLKL